MAIGRNDNLEINAPKPTRTTDIVGVDWVYATKEDIPTSMRHPFMITKDADHDGQEWWLVGGLANSDWTLYGSLATLTENHFIMGDENNKPKEVPGIEEWVTSLPTQKGQKQRTAAQVNLAADSAIIANVHNIKPIDVDLKQTVLIPYLPQQAAKFIILEAYFLGINLNPSGNTEKPNIKLIAGRGLAEEKVLFSFDVTTAISTPAANLNNKLEKIPLLLPNDITSLNLEGGLTLDVSGVSAWLYATAQLIIKALVI